MPEWSQSPFKPFLGRGRVSAVLSPIRAIYVLRWKLAKTRCIAFVEDIGSLAMPESGLRAHLDHFWDIVGV